MIFATNLAANFDPAFERRIRSHVRFDMPGADEREKIWQVQIHPHKTPLANDVDFRALAERYAVSGGDIKNAVLKAAAAAAGDGAKQIHQQHFERAMDDVVAARGVMQQSLFAPENPFNIIEPFRRLMIAALIVAGSAFVLALIALLR